MIQQHELYIRCLGDTSERIARYTLDPSVYVKVFQEISDSLPRHMINEYPTCFFRGPQDPYLLGRELFFNHILDIPY